MQLSTFSNGGFVIHKIYIGESRCRFSAWFDADGKILDCERIDARGRPYPASDKQKAAVDFACRYVKRDMAKESNQ